MPLIQLWEKNPDIVLQYNIKQIVSAAGDGILTDNSECSRELRYYLSSIREQKLFEHVQYCLANAFDKGGFVLQELVNEIGRRLDYEVENGLYQGRSNQIGYDGVWRAPNGHSIIIEIKTTDAYRMNLDIIASYKAKLIDAKKIIGNSSMLIVVGRNDTGDLEAQIRGSKHAWDTRIISTEALIKLVELKVKSDEDITTEKIRSLLIPFEYTRLDNIIDVMFATARDVETGGDSDADISNFPEIASDVAGNGEQEHTPREILDDVRRKSLTALGAREEVSLIASKRSQFWTGDKKVRAVCIASKRYPAGGYWYAFNPQQNEFLQEADRGFLVLGCVDASWAYAIPYKVLAENLPGLNTTEKPDRMYWHIHVETERGVEHFIPLPKKGERLSLKGFGLRV